MILKSILKSILILIVVILIYAIGSEMPTGPDFNYMWLSGYVAGAIATLIFNAKMGERNE